MRRVSFHQPTGPLSIANPCLPTTPQTKQRLDGFVRPERGGGQLSMSLAPCDGYQANGFRS